ncbi:MAG: MBOAT family O-acyltransferase [Myxococcota bacterium]
MSFTSLSFALILAPLLVCGPFLRGRTRRWVLLLASWAFYAWGTPWHLVLLLFSTALDYVVGRALHATPDDRGARRRGLLALSLVGNLGILGWFKYAPYALALVGLAEPPPASEFHVEGSIPIGLSFYTFQTLSYTIDVYRRKQDAIDSPLDFALFVAFFPQLVAGPVVRASEFFPQLARPVVPDAARTWSAIELVAVGLFKKLVVADNLGLLVDQVMDEPTAWSAPALVLTGVMFTTQIYADFSGYSTIARGLGRLFGIDLPRNFDFPMLARNPLEYRRGWHITMAAWFRDYVYFPMGGTRGGFLRSSFNLMVVWALFGLWHGAGWPFLAWGLLNGLLQVVYRPLSARFPWSPPVVVGTTLTLLYTSMSALTFRAPGLDGLIAIYTRIFTLCMGGAWPPLSWVAGMLVLLGVHATCKRYYRDEDLLVRLPVPARIALLGLLTPILLFASTDARPFIYFQF